MNYYTGTCRGGSCQPDACGTYVTIQGPAGPTGALYLGKVTVCKNAVSIKPPRYGY